MSPLPQVAALLPLTGDLLGILGRGAQQGEAQEQEEQAINRQTALYSLKLLCRSFGAGHPDAFVPVLSRAVELLLSPKEERNVMGSALLCIAEATSTLKALAIPQLHRSGLETRDGHKTYKLVSYEIHYDGRPRMLDCYFSFS